MKRLVVIFVLVVILLTGCRSSKDTNSSNNESLKVDKNLLDVTLTLPASMFEGEDINASAESMKEEGFKEVTVNEDGSITVKMSKSKHKELMKTMKDSTIEYFEELKTSEDFKSIQEVTYNDDFTKITLEVNQTEFEGSFDGFATFGVGLSSYMYNIYNAVPEEKIKITIDTKNFETGEIFDTVIYPDALNELETETEAE